MSIAVEWFYLVQTLFTVGLWDNDNKHLGSIEDEIWITEGY
jgi:hypothetical protein